MPATLKILVCYHKPAKLYKDDIHEPIHCGRACCTLPEEEKQWMLEHMRGDDTGENISTLGLHFAETSAIYWAWKNYNELGNPDYIGLCHYRRLFTQEDIESFANYDIMAPSEKNWRARSVREIFLEHHGTPNLEEAVSMLTEQDPSCREPAEAYLQCTEGYYYNMFIMKREIFDEYCQKLFGVLFRIHEKMDYARATYYNRRMPAFIAERLTGIFISEKEGRGRVKKCTHRRIEKSAKPDVIPKSGSRGVVVCLSADNDYAPYLLVTIASIKDNRHPGDLYELYVLDGGLSDIRRKHILSLADEAFCIRFIDINAYLDDIDTTVFQLRAHFSEATYYRFFIPEIFRHFDRLLYLDCDLIVHHNLAELYGTNMRNYALAAVPDISIHAALREPSAGEIHSYLTEKLGLKNPYSYFQAGVLLLDIKKLRGMDFTNKCLKRLQEIGKPLYVDQCVMNSVLNGEYYSLEMKWNVSWQVPYYVKFPEKRLSAEEYAEYFGARRNPCIVHYSGAIKPWKNTELELADLWWKYARKTGFYENLLTLATKRIAQDISAYRSNQIKYCWYKFLSNITFGKARRQYKRLRQICKEHIRATRDILQG